MSHTPLHEQLRRRVRELENQLAGQAANRAYQETIEDLPVFICRFLPDGTITFVNRACCQYFGRNKTNLVGASLFDFMAQCDHKRICDNIATLTRENPATVHELEVISASGIRWQRWTIRALFDEQGVAAEYESVGQDITEHKKDRNSLREARVRLEQYIEFLPDATFSIDLGGKVIVWNKGMEKLTGIPSSTMTGKDRYEYALPFYGARRPMLLDCMLCPDRTIEQAYHHFERTKDALYAQTSVTLPDSSRISLRGKAGPVYNDAGHVIGAVESIRDITEREQAECALQESERRYRLLAENIHDVIGLADIHHLRCTYISPSVERLTGYRADEIVSTQLQDLLTSEYRDRALNILAEELRHERSGREADRFRSRTFQTELVRKDGAQIWIEVSASFLRDGQGRATHVLCVIRDIDDRKRADLARRDLEQRFRIIAETSPEVFWMTTPDSSRVLYVNPSFETVYGYPCSAMYENPMLWHDVIHPEDLDHLADIIKQKHGSTVDFVMEYRIVRPDGSIRWIRDRVSPICGDDGSIIMLTGLTEDITRQKKNDEERKIYETCLSRAQKLEAIGTLAGGIAHDFNNILSAIIGYTELSLDDVPEHGRLWRNLQEVLKAGDRAKNLVKQILTFSRQADTERRPVSVHLIIKEALKLLRCSIPSTIRIVQDIAPDSGMVLADPTQIHQVIMNLCTNSFQSMADTGGDLTVSLLPVSVHDREHHPHLAEGDYLRLRVQDTGCGMERAILDRIFDPFFTTKDKSRGTGLGLATVHGIVNNLGGDVYVSSTPGIGSIFDVYLPHYTDDPDMSACRHGYTPYGHGEHILYVDDEETILQFGKTILEKLGYRVSIASSSSSALELFRSDPEEYDLVITDQTLTGMKGTQLASQILAISPRIPIILTTGLNEAVSSLSAQSFGISRFIQKPFDRSSIASVISEILNPRKEIMTSGYSDE